MTRRPHRSHSPATKAKVALAANTLDPLANLTATLTAIVNGHKQSKIDELLPWVFKGQSSQPLDEVVFKSILSTAEVRRRRARGAECSHCQLG